MDPKIMYFLAIAEELNISKAAQRLYVTQQSLSTYLKNLECEYGVTLLNRKPKPSLTLAGEVLVRTYQSMVQLENNLQMELLAISDGSKGHLRVGFHSARSTTLIPTILNEYWAKYPNITIDFIDGLTNSFEEDLLAGRLDFFIGTDPKDNRSFESVPLMREHVWIVISDSMLQKYFTAEFPGCKERFLKGVNLREFSQVPFIFNCDDSRITVAVKEFLERNSIRIPIRIKSNNGPMRIMLSAKDYGASICTNLRLRDVCQYNKDNPGKPMLNAYPIANFEYECETLLVYHKDIYQPGYVKYFKEIAIKVFSDVI